ncbi:MAG: hypothetical protein IJ898_06670 [Prevotella sp.]|nr:hypothetical protein [Prevotella sp.]
MFIVNFIVFMFGFGLIVIAISTAIPVYGYFRRRWKGLAIGCLMQPVVCAVVIGVVYASINGYHKICFNSEKKSAMVTVRSIEQEANDTDTLTWYLKADDECILLNSDEDDEEDDRFDVIRLDSLDAGVSVEDRIVVRFDIKNQKVSATDYDQPAEVVDVNWDKVRDYFSK